MKKRIVIFAMILGIVFCLYFGGGRLHNYYAWAEEKNTTHIHNTSSANDTLSIIMIGDSWAAYHHANDTILASMLQEKLQKPVRIYSSGIVGAKTKAIYEQLCDTISPKGTRDLFDREPKYCIISAGINDAVAKMGTKYYCHHYRLIIRFLISAGIKPIVLDMPDVDYLIVYKRESITANIRHRISSWFTKAPMWNFDNYRNDLQLMFDKEGIKRQIIYVPSKEWNPRGFNDPHCLYLEDHIHLNTNGYYLLDSCIASYICRDLSSILDSQ